MQSIVLSNISDSTYDLDQARSSISSSPLLRSKPSLIDLVERTNQLIDKLTDLETTTESAELLLSTRVVLINSDTSSSSWEQAPANDLVKSDKSLIIPEWPEDSVISSLQERAVEGTPLHKRRCEGSVIKPTDTPKRSKTFTTPSTPTIRIGVPAANIVEVAPHTPQVLSASIVSRMLAIAPSTPIAKRALDFASPETVKATILETTASSSSSSIAEEFEDFVKQIPTDWYSIQRRKGKIKIHLPDEMKRIKRLIYIFRSKVTKRVLIGKTAQTFQKRMAGYLAHFNKVDGEILVKKEGTKAFLSEIRKDPEQFELGVLRFAMPTEDLNRLETLFIKYWKTLGSVYNENRGGGGGITHSEAVPITYAIPKSTTASFTPVRCWSFEKDRKGNIRPKLTPSYAERIAKIREDSANPETRRVGATPAISYVIRQKKTKESYIGTSISPQRRAKEHGRAAKYQDPSHPKFNPKKSNCLYKALAQDCESFELGIYPLQSRENIPVTEHENYVFCEGIAEVETHLINRKQSHVSQGGFNSNEGGGGSLSSQSGYFSPQEKKGISTSL